MADNTVDLINLWLVLFSMGLIMTCYGLHGLIFGRT